VSEIDQLIATIRGLVRVCELLRRAGASEEELAERSADIRRLQDRLADRVRQSMRDRARA
jgi:hypothetical protein